MKQFLSKYAIILILLALGFFFQWRYINEFPSHIHAWAQADRYALAIGFNKNGFDFFHPQTYVLNHQFPGKSKIANHSVVTAVDFPIHDYVAGMLMNLFGTTAPWCFRLYVLLYSLVGLFFLYKTSELLMNDPVKSVIVVIFAASTRLFAYYQAGFLPSMPSLANGFIAIYFYSSYLKSKNLSSFIWSIFFLTLATLSRLPFAFLLMAILVFEGFMAIREKKFNVWKWVAIIVSFLAIGCYFIYNNHLRNVFGSIFLNYALPPKNVSEFMVLLKLVLKKWIYTYFTKIHYLVFVILMAGTIVALIFKKGIMKPLYRQLLVFLLLVTLGYVVYSFLMIQQFPAHDYYFLDTFYLPAILFLLILLAVLSEVHKTVKIATTILLFLACFMTIPRTLKSQVERRETGYWDHTQVTIGNFTDSKAFLASQRVSDTSKILVIDAYTPNIPFILMDKIGYAILNTSTKDIEESLKLPADYAVIQNSFLLSEVYPNYPELINRLDRVATNGKITLYRILKEPTQTDLYTFLGLAGKTPLLVQKCAFEQADTLMKTTWQKIRLTSDLHYSGTTCGYVDNPQEFGVTYKLINSPLLLDSTRLILFKGFFLRTKPLKECSIVASITSGGKNLYYNSYSLSDLLKEQNKWEEVNLFFQVPGIKEKNYKLEIYVWNKSLNLVYYDDAEVRYY
ncbi:MAG: glycosyltransferase family 39 protein [Bacteroidetes bacterium]|nr:glycosyltransferase family 39 protein [Bacteroidota bacterium]